jgi:hypothetical protein
LTLLKFINNQEFLMEVFLCFFLFTIITISMFIDMAVYDTTCAVTIGIPSPEAAQSVLNKLELSGHVVFAEADARYLYVKANCAGGRRPNLALWGLWKEVNDLSLLYGVGGFYFGDQWYRPSPEAQGKRLDWSTPPHMTPKQWWRQLTEQMGILWVFSPLLK